MAFLLLNITSKLLVQLTPFSVALRLLEPTTSAGSYHWVEAVFGLDAHIAGPLRAGWSIRYKNRLAKKVGPIGEPYYVPGYGRGGSSTFGGTFYVAIELLNKTKKERNRQA